MIDRFITKQSLHHSQCVLVHRNLCCGDFGKSQPNTSKCKYSASSGQKLLVSTVN